MIRTASVAHSSGLQRIQDIGFLLTARTGRNRVAEVARERLVETRNPVKKKLSSYIAFLKALGFSPSSTTLLTRCSHGDEARSDGQGAIPSASRAPSALALGLADHPPGGGDSLKMIRGAAVVRVGNAQPIAVAPSDLILGHLRRRADDGERFVHLTQKSTVRLVGNPRCRRLPNHSGMRLELSRNTHSVMSARRAGPTRTASNARRRAA